MDRLVIQFGIRVRVIGLQTNADLTVGRYIGREITQAEGNIIPYVGLCSDGVANLDPELGVPIEDGPRPNLGGGIWTFEVDLQED